MPIISGKDSAPFYVWGDNCNTWVLADTTGLSVKQESMPPGAKEQLHFHKNAQQYFYILKGLATFHLDGDTDTIGAGTGVLIEPGCKHYIANDTRHELEFLVISQPNIGNDRVNC